jgi:hypothetical protein
MLNEYKLRGILASDVHASVLYNTQHLRYIKISGIKFEEGSKFQLRLEFSGSLNLSHSETS